MPTISFIKIYGPPVLKALRELEKIAIEMPEVSIMNTIIGGGEYESLLSDPDYTANYFSSLPTPIEIKVERRSTIISKSGQKLGEYDFFFEWFTDPSMDQLNDLIQKVDEALAPLGCRYTITTKK